MLFNIFTGLYNYHHSLILEHFHPLKRNSILTSYNSPFCPIYFLPLLQICLFQIYQMNGILCYMAFCDQLPLLTLMFPRFVHVAASISTSLLPTVNTHCMAHHVWLTYSSAVDIRVVSTGAIMNSAAMIICVQVLVWICTFISWLYSYRWNEWNQ